MKMMYRIWCMIAVSALLISGCTGGKKDYHRSISVFGTAQVYVAPDEALISFTVSTKEKDLATAKQKNDLLLQKLHSIVNNFNIDKKYVSLDYSTVHPEYAYHPELGTQTLAGYNVRQNMSIKITDITCYEAFVAALLNAGIDTIHNTEFTNSELRKYRDSARSQAIKAAVAKAELLCTEATQSNKPIRLGKILEIREISSANRPYRTTPNLAVQNTVMYEYAQTVEHDHLIPLGHIPVQAEIEVIFALE